MLAYQANKLEIPKRDVVSHPRDLYDRSKLINHLIFVARSLRNRTALEGRTPEAVARELRVRIRGSDDGSIEIRARSGDCLIL